MAVSETYISLLVMAGTILITATCRRWNRQYMYNKPSGYCFFLELFGAFQVCACTQELCLLADLPPKPQMALTLTYIFTVLHGLTLPDSVTNPSSSFQLLCKGDIRAKTWLLQTSAQFTGAVLANVYVRSLSEVIPNHSKALAAHCNNPIQTSIGNAFILELLFSFLFHMSLLQFESTSDRIKVHLIALLITVLVYEGGHLTGAIFNPALAFSLHINCFSEKFWDYVLVYWVAPCVGSVMVFILWDEVLPLLQGRT
uniref:Aquaporin 11 n=1 Tax=Salvator merianae TaxID=96440 RepID=A0A8D0BTX7_SALMN